MYQYPVYIFHYQDFEKEISFFFSKKINNKNTIIRKISFANKQFINNYKYFFINISFTLFKTSLFSLLYSLMELNAFVKLNQLILLISET